MSIRLCLAPWLLWDGRCAPGWSILGVRQAHPHTPSPRVPDARFIWGHHGESALLSPALQVGLKTLSAQAGSLWEGLLALLDVSVSPE